jgi:hypothetical protein
MEASAALTAGGMVWANVVTERMRNNAAVARMGVKFELLETVGLGASSLEQMRVA